MTRRTRSTLLALLAATLAQAGTSACAAAPDKVATALKHSLGEHGAAAKVREEPGPLGTTVVKAVVDGAYPGTGVAATVVEHGVSYGLHGERDLAELVRARGWLHKPPAYDAYRTLVDDALFEGLGAFDDAAPHQLRKVGAALELTATRRLMPSGAQERVLVRVGPSGNAVVERGEGGGAAAAGPASGGGAHDRVGAGERAFAAGEWMTLSKLIPQLDAKDPRARALLARATTAANPQVAADAMGALPPTAESATALNSAWKSLAAAKRAELLQLAGDTHGPDFAARLKP